MPNTYIKLPHARGLQNPPPNQPDGFWSDKLVAYLRTLPKHGMPIGQRHQVFQDHPIPEGLDCWLRIHYARNIDTAQAVNSVRNSLIQSGDFQIEQVPNELPGIDPEWITLGAQV